MRIPGGDLAPARRRRYGGTYGRRRRRRAQALVVVLLVAAAGSGAYLLRRDDSAAPQRLTARPVATPCPTPTTAPVRALPAPQQVRLSLLNGTPRNGLAKAIGDQLAARGFVVTAQANAPAALAGPSVVAYAPGAEAAGELVSHWVLGSTARPDAKVARGTVQVTLGSDFRRLASPAEAAARNTPTATPTPSDCG